MRSSFALLRAPALSLEEAQELRRTGEYLDDELIVQAIRAATGPELVELGETKTRAAAAIRRYAMRMGSRPTPFALFAGTGVVGIGKPISLALGGRPSYRARVRLDIVALEALVAHVLESTPLERLPVYLNPTLRVAGSAYRFSRRGDASADVVCIGINDTLTAVIEACTGDVLGGDLADALSRKSPGTPREQILEYLARLVDREFLIPDSRLLWPGRELSTVAAGLLERAGWTEWADQLRDLARATEGVRTVRAGLLDDLARPWASTARTVTPLATIKETERFHIDLEYEVSGRLDTRLVRDVEATLRRLQLMFPRRDPLKDLRMAFQARYEDATVPLLEAVDYESGILREALRSRSPLADSAGVGGGPALTYDRGALEDIQVQALSHWQRTGTPFDISGFPQATEGLTRCAMVALLSGDAEPYRCVLTGATTRAPAALLGRFALSRPELAGPLQQWAAQRNGADADRPIFAELIHTPGGRIGNVLLRDRLSTYAVAIPNAGGDFALDRILIRLEGDRFSLYDAETGRQIILELNSAHSADAFENSPIYRVLAHISDRAAVGWHWGPLHSLCHLPRVTCGSVIVAPERWAVDREKVVKAVKSPAPGQQLIRLLPNLGERQWIGTGHDDEVLAIDLNSPQALGGILKASARQQYVYFIEIPQVEHPALTSPTGRHVAEVCFIPQHADVAEPGGAERRAHVGTAHDRRWAYFKYYCGPMSADTVAVRAKQVIEELHSRGMIDRWFYIRYDDEGHHVRVRAHASAPGQRGDVVATLARLGEELRERGIVHRVGMDDYVPEVQRYGGPSSIEYAERVFSADSDDLAAFLATDPPERTRVLRAAADAMRWVWLAEAEHDAVLECLRFGQRGLNARDHHSAKKRGAFWRQNENELDAIMRDSCLAEPVAASLTELVDVLARTRSRRALLVTLTSLIHMHCNRLFAVDSRRLEDLAYDLAVRRAVKARALGLRLDHDRQAVLADVRAKV